MRAVSLQHDWILHADVDEFHEYPEDVTAFLTHCDARGMNVVSGILRDRASMYAFGGRCFLTDTHTHTATERFRIWTPSSRSSSNFPCNATSLQFASERHTVSMSFVLAVHRRRIRLQDFGA